MTAAGLSALGLGAPVVRPLQLLVAHVVLFQPALLAFRFWEL